MHFAPVDLHKLSRDVPLPGLTVGSVQFFSLSVRYTNSLFGSFLPLIQSERSSKDLLLERNKKTLHHKFLDSQGDRKSRGNAGRTEHAMHDGIVT